MKYKSRIFFSMLFASLFCFINHGNLAFAKESAVLSKVKGKVTVLKAGKTKGLPGKVNTELSAGDQIVTIGKESNADITFPTGDIVRIMPDSKLEIKESDFKKKTSRVRLKLFAGKIFNIISKLSKDSKYEVETRIAVAGVRGTIWSAETTGKGEDVIMVKEGKVATTNPGVDPKKEIIVADLKKTIIKAGALPAKPIPMTPEEIAMFDILDDILHETMEDMREEEKDSIAEDIMNQIISEP